MNELSFARSETKFINKTFLYMALGLIITFGVGYFVSSTQFMYILLSQSPVGITIGLAVIEFALVVFLSRRINKMSVQTAATSFIVYSVINGITFSVFFLVYDMQSILSVFLLAAVMFAASGFIGATIQKDLSVFGRFMLMAVIGIVVVSIINLFLQLSGLAIAINYISILVFCGLTAYDMQTIKAIHYQSYYMDNTAVNKYAIVGALNLYLDFINIFIHLLQLLGREK